MERIAKFEKVTIEQFAADLHKPELAAECYDQVQLPTRATAGSAGYDVKSPFAFTLAPGETIKIATGLRVKIAKGWVMLVMPKSGLGTKFRVQLDNTVGVVDQDYYYADNQGHFMVQITNDSKNGAVMEIPQGKAFCQVLFVPFGITEDDAASGVRTGGFGSTKA